MADLDGISYLRTTRADTPVIYGPDEDFPVGGAQGRPLLGRRRGDDLIGAGITLHEALKAADTLAEEGVSARVIDLYSVKPIDVETLRAAAEATGGRFVVAEDHWPEGGLGEAVLSAFADSDERPRADPPRRARDARLGQAGRASRTPPASTPNTSPPPPGSSSARPSARKAEANTRSSPPGWG